MDKDFYQTIQSALKDRSSWEDKQTTWNKMRNGGLKRTAKPYPGAPDLHYALGDSSIGKIKPLYIQQLYGGETIASFIALQEQDAEATSSANYWFDYNLKQKSNFEREIFVAADQLEERGSVPVKIRWHTECGRLAFTTCEPLHVIVPQGTEELSDSDWLVHVLHLSEDQYRANKNYKQEDDFIKSIKGKGKETSGDTTLEQNKQQREGITYSDNENTIILWECYRRDREGKKITVDTCSPVLPCDENEVRDQFGLPYNKGYFKDGQRFPFMKFRAEIKEKGYYSERGTMERVAPHESSLNRTWNFKHEWMDFFARPTFSTDKPVPNPSNIKCRPGAIYGDGLTPNNPPPPPAFLDQEMGFTRAVAEDLIQIPDLGASEHLSGKPDSKGNVTATQINAIVGQSGQGQDLRSRVFRMDLGELLNMAWSLYIQYAQTDFMFVLDGEIQETTKEALHDKYQISPNGSPDSWNKGQQLQKAIAMFQLLKDNPFIDQGELTKMVIETYDPRKVKRLYRDPGIATQDQQEQQAVENLLMADGYPVKTRPSDDDKAHLITQGQYVQQKLMTGEPIAPKEATLQLAHGQEHLQALTQKKDPEVKQLTQQMMPIVQALMQIASMGGQEGQAGAPSNIVPGPGSPSAGQQATMPQAQTNGKAPDVVGDSTKILNALAALIKSGVPITHEEINNTLARLNLPPISMTPVAAPPPVPHQAALQMAQPIQ